MYVKLLPTVLLSLLHCLLAKAPSPLIDIVMFRLTLISFVLPHLIVYISCNTKNENYRY